MKVGFTGTRKGLNQNQKNLLKRFFQKNQIEEFIHGDAIGSDEQAHEILLSVKPQTYVKIFPSFNDRAFCSVKQGKIFEESDPLQRNKKIVDSCDRLLVCPESSKEKLRSGTWSTYRYAIKTNKETTLLI